jgi:membrane protein YdbS with pleckstrin-like domain
MEYRLKRIAVRAWDMSVPMVGMTPWWAFGLDNITIAIIMVVILVIVWRYWDRHWKCMISE